MGLMQPGEKRQIADISSSRQIRITASHAPADIDIAAFGLNSDRRIGDDRYVVLVSNERSPEGALAFAKSGKATTISVDLDRLPADIHQVTITATHDTIPLRQAGVLKAEIGSVTIDAKPSLGDEKAIMLLELYRHGGDWRLGSIVQGFNGGLAALVEHFGGEVADELTHAAPAAVAPCPSPVSLSKVDLRKQKVGISLNKLGVEHEKAEITFVIDASGSMASLYSKGVVQETVERIAPVALRLDDDGSMATWFYASRCKQVEDLTATNLEGFVTRTLPSPGAKIGAVPTGKKGFFGGDAKAGGESIGYGNNEPVIMTAILEQQPQKRSTPLFIIFLTDGGIDGSTSKVIQKILRDTSGKPIFWQFIGVGKANYGVLRELDTITGRVVDNAGFFSVDDLSEISDDDLYDRILAEFPLWLKAARTANILP